MSANIKTETALPKLQSKDAIKSGQDKIRGTLLNLDGEIHANAVQCLMHAEQHGDTSLMRRLLIEVIDAKTGYRRQGLINWMRKWSPMELKGDTINLSGVDGKGHKRPFVVAEANAKPFWTDRDNAERVARPVFKDTVLARIDASIKDILAAVDNTKDGKAVDPTKPFYDGVHTDKIVDFAKKVAEMRDALPPDETREVRLTQARIAKDQEFVASNKDNVNLAGMKPSEALEEMGGNSTQREAHAA